MYEMNSENCIAYSIENGREICLVKRGVPPKDCEKCENNKKRRKSDSFADFSKTGENQRTTLADKEKFTVLEYRSLKKSEDISFCIRKQLDKIYLSKKCVQVLGKPEYVIFAMSEDKKKLQIRTADSSTANAVKVTLNKNRSGADIYSVYITRQIQPYGTYGVGKQLNENIGEVIFELEKKETI